MREQLSWVRVGLVKQPRRLIRPFRRLPTLAPTANRGPCAPESVSDVRGRALDPFPAIVNCLLEALVLISVGHLAKAARKPEPKQSLDGDRQCRAASAHFCNA